MDTSTPVSKPGPTWRRKLVFPLLFFVAGIGVAGWGVTQTEFGRSIAGLQTPNAAIVAPNDAPAAQGSAPSDQAAARIAELEASLAQQQSSAPIRVATVSSRADGMLLAFAARRALELGLPLGSFEDDLNARFGSSEPHMVAAVVAAAKTPVTIAKLRGDLIGLLPQLSGVESAGLWDRLTTGFSNLATVRRGDDAPHDPNALLAQAKTAMETGDVDTALQAISRLPNRAVAADWMAAARRYSEAQRALNALEKAALSSTDAQPSPGEFLLPEPTPAMPAPEAAPSALNR
jgi:hypothetical protein